MSDSRRRRDEKTARREARRKARRQHDPDDPPLLGDVRRALDEPHPLSMLMFGSMLMSITDPRGDHPFGPRDAARASLPELVTTFIEVPASETSALLAVLAEMGGQDETLSARIRRELAVRPPPEPAWLTELSAAEPYRAVVMSHILGDGDNIILGIRLPGGHEMTCVVYVDHNLGTLVKDAFFVAEPITVIIDKYQELADDPDTRWDEMPLADAKARVTAAIGMAAMTVPPFETETWPASRALLEWLIRDLPDDGQCYQRPQWDSTALTVLADEFFDSDGNIDDHDHRFLLEVILRYATDYGSGDPLRWSPVKVELLLADWLPRKVLGSVESMSPAPELLRAFIRFAHARAGIRADLTEEALAAVDTWEPEYQREIRADFESPASDEDLGAMMIDYLCREVGGAAQLARLGDDPLPDEPFDWDEIPDDIVARVTEVLELIDRCCDDILDVEYRTACRRLLSRAAAGDPNVFRRKAGAHTAAAAIVWVIGKANDLFGHRGRMTAKDLLAYFGVKGSASQRAATLLRAAGVRDQTYDVELGSPDYLTSARRRHILELRERYRDFDESF